MQFDVVTIFPDFFRSILECGLVKRAQAGGQLRVALHDLRDFTEDRHRTVDDRPFGGGPGMVFKPQPLFRAVEAIKSDQPEASIPIILLSPQGRLLRQPVVEELSRHRRVVLICGRYEGVDERVAENLATDELSIGDYVLSGGEVAAAVVMESVTRLLPGVVGNEESVEQDSFGLDGISGREAGNGLLDCPHYTRPADFRGMAVPEVLLSGDHEGIRRWRRRRALEKTWRKRPELLAGLDLNKEDLRLLDELKQASLPVLSREG
ncbi:MAG TPA: tRNA (guanosine(37)-N1)-methyltransferase TrmD [Terriglobia bacterium]|nr:tRNA (guanosine(37)-N1)-methyltransferase TrmD [Terriglobia bacterium]